MQKFNPSKGYWRITPQNRFHIVKDIGGKNIVIFKKIETRKLWSQLNKVRFCSVFEKNFFYLSGVMSLVVKYSIPIRFLIPISCFGIF
jgi:hypothetical protein